MISGGFAITTGMRRVIVRTGPEDGLSTVAHTELYTDGSVFAGTKLRDFAERKPDRGLPGADTDAWIDDEYLSLVDSQGPSV